MNTLDALVGVTTTYYRFDWQREATRQGDVVYWLHADHLGSTSLATDAGGNTVGLARYWPWGNEVAVAGSLPTDRLFTGQRREPGTGVYDYGARFYYGVTGQFLSPDSLVPRPGDPQSLNRYSYVSN